MSKLKIKKIEALAEEFTYTIEPCYEMVQARFKWLMMEEGHFPNSVEHEAGTYYREDFITDGEKQEWELEYHG